MNNFWEVLEERTEFHAAGGELEGLVAVRVGPFSVLTGKLCRDSARINCFWFYFSVHSSVAAFQCLNASLIHAFFQAFQRNSVILIWTISNMGK